MMGRRPGHFTAATWNVYHGTHRATLEPALDQLLAADVSIILGQEMALPEHRAMLSAAGYEVFRHPRQYVVAWLPGAWVPVAETGVRLSPTSYYGAGGDHHQYSEAAAVILSDHLGRTLEALSYHTPAHVQRADPAANRVQAARESMAALQARARANQTRANLFGGDDNVDERGHFVPWRTRGGPLLQVQAPAGTHGRRRIDDFRVTGLTPGGGRVIAVPAPDDHHIHVRRFSWS